MAQTFDAVSLELSPVASHVGFTNNQPQVAASLADDGTLIYLTNSRIDRQMVWYDRAGVQVGRAARTGIRPAAVSLSPDGKRVLFMRDDKGRAVLWHDDLERNQEVRLTNPPLLPGAAVWSPDGQRFAFSGTRTAEERGIYVKSVNGGVEQIVLRGGANLIAVSDWSRDGRWIVYTENDPKTLANIWLLPTGQAQSAAKPIPLLRTAAMESQGQLSPDGKWLAYVSSENGRLQVYLRPLNGSAPLPDTRWQVSLSSTGGVQPRWRADGKELFYLDNADFESRGKIMSVTIGTGTNPAGPPKALFEFRSSLIVPLGNIFVYSPSPDGQRFLVDAFATDVQPTLEVISNWAGSHP